MTVQILVGSALDRLGEIPDESIHCCVTSPPYWGLRSYKGDPGKIGLEPTYDEHLENLVAVFREVRRVLRKDGTYPELWGCLLGKGSRPPFWRDFGRWADRWREGSRWTRHRPQDLMLSHARVRLLSMEMAGGSLEMIVWHKPNPMPEISQGPAHVGA